MRLLRLVFLCIFLYAVGGLIQFTAHALFTAHVLRKPIDLTANKGTGQIILYLLVLLSVAGFARWVWKEPLGERLRLYRQQWRTSLRGFALMAGITLIAQMILFAILMAFGLDRWSSEAAHHFTAKIINNTLKALLIIPVLTTTEELIFRAFAFNYLREQAAHIGINRRDMMAAIGSALIFALSHEFHTPLEWFTRNGWPMFIGLVLLGVLLAVTYRATGSLAAGIGVHTALVWLNEFYKITGLLVFNITSPWMGVNNDLRTAPVVWILFILLTVLFWKWGPRLRPQLCVESDDFSQELGPGARSLADTSAR